MGNIVLLDELTINKIAAGEVIERPASVIKEMVENSIDAGATNITVEIKNGGISFIKITDNGKGIAQDDLEIAFERHATSKIRSADDLDTVTSMGFRGEALASIAAISTVELTSKTKEQEIGYKVVVEAGDVLQKEEIGCQNGTTITVRNLFFNTPVRYKFLKKDYTEAGYIEDVITRIALVNPNISIKLISSGKTIIQTNGSGELKNVIYSIYGKDVANGIMETTYEYEDIKITGVIGKPEIARSNRSNQLFFVNKRYIKDKTLTAATEQAYKGLIPIGKFGFVVLNMEMDPAKVDVNVHPAKLEVRFQEENKVFQAVYHAIKDTLLKSELVANTGTRIDRTAESFEERLKNIRENGKQQTGGLFSFRKQKGKQIEQYTEQESKIKTNKLEETKLEQQEENAQIEDNRKIENNETMKNNKTIGNMGKPMDTSDILLQLKQMKEKIEKEIVDKNNGVEVREEQEDYKLEDNKQLINESEKVEDKSIWKNYTVNLDLNVDDNIKQNNDELNTQENEIETKKMKDKDGQAEIIENNTQSKTEISLENNENEISKDNEESLNNEEAEVNNENEANKNNEEAEINNQNEIIEDNVNEKRMEENTDNKSDYNGENLDILNVNLAIENIDDPDVQKEFEEVKQKMQDLNNNSQEVSEDFNEMYTKLFGRPPIQEDEEDDNEEEETIAIDIVKDNISVFEDQEEFKKPTYKFIGIVFKTYIILEIDKEMYILDQHAAHERIMYEKVKKNYYSDEKKDSQILLLPDVITLTHKEMDIARDNMQMFKQAGFSLEEFGENTIKLTGVPSVCIDLNNRDLFLETLDEINTVARTAKQEKEEKFIATVACKAAVKANMALTDEEVASLMNELLELPNPFTCPHGRPTAIKMTKYDIERKFARK